MNRSALLAILALSLSAHAIERSAAVKSEFRHTHPCPSTGRVTGACPGWQVDHIQALKCGGQDSADNMQWLTIQAHKEKTRRDMRGCRHRMP